MIFRSKWQERVLSSANKVNLKFCEQCGRSFMKMRNSNGPRIDPWGTPIDMGRLSECASAMVTCCVRFVRYDLNQSLVMPRIP